LDKTPWGKPIWDICLYMRKEYGGIHQIKNIDELDTITT
jgi:hypothetical protein